MTDTELNSINEMNAGKYRQGSKIVSSTSIELSAAVSSNRPDKKGVEKFTHRNQSVDRRARTPLMH